MNPIRLAGFAFVIALTLPLSNEITAANLSAAETADIADIDGVIMNGGKMLTIQHGKSDAPLDHDMMMSDGTKVKPDGTVQRKSGLETRLRSGQVIMLDGHIMDGGKAAAMCR